MEILITNETPFKAVKNQFAIGPSSSGYQLAFSADKETWTLDADAIVPSGENLVYLGSVQYLWYKLVGNSGSVKAIV